MVCNEHTDEWLREMIAMETEGERCPYQTDPPAVVMSDLTPALLRRQAA